MGKENPEQRLGFPWDSDPDDAAERTRETKNPKYW